MLVQASIAAPTGLFSIQHFLRLLGRFLSTSIFSTRYPHLISELKYNSLFSSHESSLEMYKRLGPWETVSRDLRSPSVMPRCVLRAMKLIKVLVDVDHRDSGDRQVVAFVALAQVCLRKVASVLGEQWLATTRTSYKYR